MSKIRDAREESQKGPALDHTSTDGQTSTDLPPLKPRRGLFILFAILLVLLFASLLAMYFTTVYPYRDKPHSVETDQPNEPAGQK